MKVTRTELQSFFAAELPAMSELADAFTFHAFEIDSIDGDELDVKVLPNRTADCSGTEGVARELAAILDLPLNDATEPDYSGAPTVAVTVAGINMVLGSDFSREDLLDVLGRLRFKVEEDGDTLHVTAPLPRTDIAILEDVAEEVGQVLGYDHIAPVELPPIKGKPDQARFRGIEKVKDWLVERGFSEISTQSFAVKGDIKLANPMDKTHPYLRTNLDENMKDALAKARHYAPLVLMPGQKPKLFEVGNVFPKAGEHLAVATSEPVPDLPAIEDNASYEPQRVELGAFKPFSPYPFTTRDIAFWMPAETDSNAVERMIRENAGELLVRLDQFDRFEKERKVSLAFRLVFQSFDRTLTDDEVNAIMEKISAALAAQGYEVR